MVKNVPKNCEVSVKKIIHLESSFWSKIQFNSFNKGVYTAQKWCKMLSINHIFATRFGPFRCKELSAKSSFRSFPLYWLLNGDPHNALL